MNETQRSAVDAYVMDKLIPPDAALRAALAENARADLPI
jgi:hypothetical protein